VWDTKCAKSERRISLERSSSRWDENVKLGCQCVDTIRLAQERFLWPTFVSMVIILWVPEKAGNFCITCANISFPKMTLLPGVRQSGRPVLKIIRTRSCATYSNSLSYKLRLPASQKINSRMYKRYRRK
jgi:hypothetical protein